MNTGRYSTNHQLPPFHISLQLTLYQQPNLFISFFAGQDTLPTTNFRHSISHCSTLSTNNQIYSFHISLDKILYQPPTSDISYLSAPHSLSKIKFINLKFHRLNTGRYSTNNQLPPFHISLQHTHYQQPNLCISYFAGQDTLPTTNFRHFISQCTTLFIKD